MTHFSRRKLLQSAAGISLASVPLWYSQEAAARRDDKPKRRTIGPNDTISVGLIGAGGSKGGFKQGLGVTRGISRQPGVKVVAVCDVDAVHRAEAAAVFGPQTAAYEDFRVLLARSDIDAVVIGAPDHWHGVMAVRAMESGKDVYCEKPLTLTIDEGKKIVETAKKTGAVFQTGSQQRSDARFRMACELVRNGRIGKVSKVEAFIPGARKGGPFPVQDAPADLNWDLWLGPAPETPYIKERTHGNFRYWYEYAGGMVTDWGAHHLDISQWGLGRDGSGPVKIDAKGEPPAPDPENRSYNVHPSFEITYTYEDGVPLLLTNKGENGVKFWGEDNKWIFVSRGKIEASDPQLLEEPLPEDRAVKLYNSANHHANFVECIRTREQPICNAEVGHRSVSVCHLGNIGLRLGRPLEWNPKKEEFKNDKDANKMRSRPMRKPWKI